MPDAEKAAQQARRAEEAERKRAEQERRAQERSLREFGQGAAHNRYTGWGEGIGGLRAAKKVPGAKGS